MSQASLKSMSPSRLRWSASPLAFPSPPSHGRKMARKSYNVFTPDGRITAFHFGIVSGSSFESSGFMGNGTIEGLLEAMTEFNMNDIRLLGELVLVSVLSFDRLERGDTANYTCTATNMLPQTTTLTALSPSIPLVVLGKLMQSSQTP